MKKGYCYRWDHKYNQHNIYVGSTVNDIKREGEHRKEYKNPNRKAYSKPFYEYIRKYGTIDDWTMTVIYKGPNFKIFEKNYIKSTWQYNLNDYIPLPTKQEKKDKRQAYRVANRDILNAKQKTYNEANKDNLYEKAKAYYEANRDILNEKRREKIPCDNCGAFIRKDSKSRHIKSKKCMAFKSGNT